MGEDPRKIGEPGRIQNPEVGSWESKELQISRRMLEKELESYC